MDESKLKEIIEQCHVLQAQKKHSEVVALLEAEGAPIFSHPAISHEYFLSIRVTDRKEQGLALLRDAVQKEPENELLRYELGWYSLLTQHFDEAISNLLVITTRKKMDKRTVASLRLLAMAYSHSHDYRKSMSALRKYVSLGGRIESLEKPTLARNFVGMHLPEWGIPILEELLEQKHDSESIIQYRQNLETAYEETDSLEQAINNYKNLIMLTPDDANLVERYHMCLLDHNMEDKVIDDAEQRLKTKPDETRLMKALIMAYLGRTEDEKDELKKAWMVNKAEALLNSAIAIKPDDMGVKSMAGIIAMYKEDYQAAEQTFVEIGEIAPDSHIAYDGISSVFIHEGRIYDGLVASLDAASCQIINRGHVELSTQKRIRHCLSNLPDISTTIHDLHEAFINSRLDPGVGFVLASLLDFTKQEEERDRIARIIALNLKDDPRMLATLKPIDYDSKNPVKLAFINILSPNMYIIKIADPDKARKKEEQRLSGEYRVMKSLRKITSNVPEAIYYEKGVLLEQRISSPNLWQANYRETSAEFEHEAMKCLETLAMIHAHGNKQLKHDGIKVPSFSFEENTLKRLVERLGNSPESQHFLKQYSRFTRLVVESIPNTYFFDGLQHGDPNYGNVLVGGFVVDLENVRSGNVIIDTAGYLTNPTKYRLDRRSMFDNYLDLFVREREQEGISAPSDVRQIAASLLNLGVLHSHLTLTGPMISDMRIEEARYHANSAVAIMNSFGQHALAESFTQAVNRKN